MSEPGQDPILEQHAESAAASLGKLVLGRDLNGEEAEAMGTIFRAAAEALKHGFIARLAQHVLAERDSESIEEFFDENLRAT